MATVRSSSSLRLRQLSTSSLQPSTSSNSTQCTLIPRTQIRNATYIPRPKRPYAFTQLFTLSDGSTFLHRTTSPAPVYKSTRDTRNTPLWNPSNARMANVEEDEAGRLRAFRRRFGRAFDSREGEPAPARVEEGVAAAPAEAPTATREEDGVVKQVVRRDALMGGKSEGKGKAADDADAEAEAKVEMSKDRPPPSATLKTQKEADPESQGMGATGSWGEDFGEGDNLMDLISSYGTNEHAQKTQQQESQGTPKSTKSGKGKK